MSEANIVYFDAARVSKGILSGDTDLVESLLRSIEPVKMYEVYARVIHDLSLSINTPSLDVFMKNDLMRQRDILRSIFNKVQNFIVERIKINHMEPGYPKHQAMMNLLGKDPLTYHQWCDVQVNLQESVR